MASMAAWLLSVVADGTQRHQGQRSVCAPPKILVLGGRLHPHLLRRISAHVGEEAAVFGGLNQFCLQEVIAFTFVPFSAWQRHKLTIKNKQPIMCSDVLLENLPMWLQFVDRSGSTVCGASYRICHIEGKQSALEISSVSIHEHPLFFFQFYVYVYSYVSPHASFEMCVDMWALEGLDEAQNGGACFHLQQQSEPSCRCLIWQWKGFGSPKLQEKNPYILMYCLELSHVDFEFICTCSESSISEIFFHHNHCCDWTTSSERK